MAARSSVLQKSGKERIKKDSVVLGVSLVDGVPLGYRYVRLPP